MILDLLKSGFPCVLLQTLEPHRTEDEIRKIPGWRIARWDCLQGIRSFPPQSSLQEDLQNPVDAVNWLSSAKDTVLICHGLAAYLDDPMVSQSILNAIPLYKGCGNCLVLISPTPTLPLPLQPFFHLVEVRLPEEEALFRLQADLGETLNIRPNRKAARLATGLTEFQAETAYALSLTKKGYFSSKCVTEAKTQMIKKSGLLEIFPAADIADVGGLTPLKEYVLNRSQAYQPDSALPKPKGILLVGVPGTGKSKTACAIASMLKFPLIRMDIGALKNALVGESERRMREATKIIDAFGNCVLFLDELEKMFSGTKSGLNDSGTTMGMFSHFLTWANDQKTAFIVATANNIKELPPEFLRAGRFDAIWFVDLPSRIERAEIIKIMNRKYGTSMPETWADELTGYTGSEIEQILRDSVFDGLDVARRSLIPLSRTMKEDIEQLRQWARSRARIANTPEEESTEIRKIRRTPKIKSVSAPSTSIH